MYSLSLDYIFNRVYDVLLWIKYTWLFTILRKDPEVYLAEHAYRDWDGLRDRGWFDEYFAQQDGTVSAIDTHVSLWQQFLEKLGLRLPDSDGDGIPDVTDNRPYDAENLSKASLKERYESDYSFMDHVRDVFGIGPKDTDKDGVPDSYEKNHSLSVRDPDTDHDGLLDGQELGMGTDPLNSDTDNDLVLDGRDEAPLDPSVSALLSDTDHDGVSDKIEKVLGTDPAKVDTDNDGIPDSMDTYPLDPENLSKIPLIDFEKVGEGLHFSIQNPVLSFFSDVLSVLMLIAVVFFVYVVVRWLTIFLEGLHHYEHHFHHEDHGEHGGKSIHIIKDTSSHQVPMPAGIPGLPVAEDDQVPFGTVQEPTSTNHPKFSVIQGYLQSTSEALWRIGIMEADNLLLEVLEEKGYQGDGVGEKLKNASFKTIDLAWDAHKVRNRIAHEGSNFELTEREAKRAFMLFESVFRDLKVIK